MHPFPTELWERIVNNLGQQVLLSFAITSCRFLQSLSAPIVYDDVDLHTNRPFKMHKFYRSVAARPYLGALVHTIHIQIPKYPEVPSHTIPEQLTMLPNLVELELLQADVDATLLSTIFHILPHLRAISLFQSELPSDIRVVSDGEISNIEPISLRSLHLSGFSLTNPAAALLVHFTGHRYNHALTTLKIQYHDCIPHSLLPFLLSTPDILHLSLQSSDPAPSHPIHTLPHGAIPRLTHFAGSAVCAAIFVPGRPVSSIAINILASDADDVLRISESSTVPVKSLRLKYPGPRLRYAPKTLRCLNWSSAKKERVPL